MKRITIIRDKYLLGLVLMSMALYVASLLPLMLDVHNVDTLALGVVIALGVLGVYVVVLGKLVRCIRLGEQSFAIGRERIDYVYVNEMHFTDRITIYADFLARRMEVDAAGLTRNESKYRAVLKHLKAKCELPYDVDDAIHELKEGQAHKYRSEDNHPPKIRGWLGLLMVLVAVEIVAMGAMCWFMCRVTFAFGLAVTHRLVYVVGAVLGGITVLVGLVALILALKKRISAIRWMRCFGWLQGVLGFGLGLYMGLMHQRTEVLELVLGGAYAWVGMLIMLRYLRISRRVQQTFVRGKKTDSEGHPRGSKVWRIAVGIICIAFLVLVAVIIIDEASMGGKVYTSVEEMIGEQAEAEYIDKGQYGFMIKGEGRTRKTLVWQESEDNYVTLGMFGGAEHAIRFVDTDEVQAVIDLYYHEGKGIILLDVHPMDKAVEVEDGNGGLEPERIHGHDYYLWVIEPRNDDMYWMRIKVDGEAVYGLSEFDLGMAFEDWKDWYAVE